MFTLRRREFITLVGGAAAAAWPLAARAQQPADRIARGGFFGADRSTPLGATLYQAFIDELQIHGFKNGQNLIVDYRRVDRDSRRYQPTQPHSWDRTSMYLSRKEPSQPCKRRSVRLA